MRDESARNDPKRLWQTQPTEESKMTVEKIREKARDLQRKTRRTRLRGTAVSLFVVGLSAYGIGLAGDPMVRALFIVAILWTLAGQYFLNRGMWAAMQPRDAASITGIESYRREVERQRFLSGGFLLWSFGPLAVAIVALSALILNLGIKNRGLTLESTVRNMTPFLGLLAVWLVGVFVIRMRERRNLKREIEELEAIERGKN